MIGYEDKIQSTCLKSAPCITSSDHTPVYSEFIVKTHQLPPKQDDSLGVCSMFITELRVKVMSTSTQTMQNPYISFNAPFMPRAVDTAYVSLSSSNSEYDVEWKDTDTPVIHLFANNKEYIRNTCLFIQLSDSGYTFDGHVAGGYVRMDSVIENGKPTKFSVLLLSGGLKAIQLFGVITLSWARVLKSKPQEKAMWQLDIRHDRCQNCAGLFTVFRRRHHCRACGLLVCGGCSRNKLVVPSYGTVEQRACDRCWHSKDKKKWLHLI